MAVVPNFWSLIDFLHAFLSEVDFSKTPFLESLAFKLRNRYQRGPNFLKMDSEYLFSWSKSTLARKFFSTSMK